jgi:hypothetical protein
VICRVRTLRQCPFLVAWECIGALFRTGAQPNASGEAPELIGEVGDGETHSSGESIKGYSISSIAYESASRQFFAVPEEACCPKARRGVSPLFSEGFAFFGTPSEEPNCLRSEYMSILYSADFSD